MRAISSAQARKHFGHYQDRAKRGPIQVTRRGRPSVVILSIEDYDRLRDLDRRALLVTELSERHIAALDVAEIPPAHRYSLKDIR